MFLRIAGPTSGPKIGGPIRTATRQGDYVICSGSRGTADIAAASVVPPSRKKLLKRALALCAIFPLLASEILSLCREPAILRLFVDFGYSLFPLCVHLVPFGNANSGFVGVLSSPPRLSVPVSRIQPNHSRLAVIAVGLSADITTAPFVHKCSTTMRLWGSGIHCFHYDSVPAEVKTLWRSNSN